jgi:hypothetical protein
MNVRGYGLESPKRYPIEKLSIGQEYITYMYTPYSDYSFTVWVEVVQKSDNSVILHSKPDNHKCTSVSIGENEDTAFIGNKSYRVEILGLVPIEKSEDLFIYTGRKQDEDESGVYVYARDYIREFSTTCDASKLHVDTMTTDIILQLDLYEPHYSLKTILGSDAIEIKRYDTKHDVWLAMVSNLTSFSAYSVKLDSLIKDIELMTL